MTIINISPVTEGGTVPFLNISDLVAPPQSYMFLQHNTDVRNDEASIFFQRNVNTDDGYVNPKCLKVETNVNVDTDQTEWAISGVINSYSDAQSDGNTATSGVANKHGTGSVFGGHFQANDHNIYEAATDVTPVIGAEINIQAIGPDHPTANNGHGNRVMLDLPAKTLSGGATAEIGMGIRIRTAGASLRSGLFVSEDGTNKIKTAINLATSGDYGLYFSGDKTVAEAVFSGNSQNGIILNGTYTDSAIRIPAGQYFAVENTGVIKTSYSGGFWRFWNGAVEKISFDMDVAAIHLAGIKVIGQRKTGWALDTGTVKRTTNATYSGTANGTYSQATLQALMNAVRDLSQTVKALKDDLAAHGLVGP